MDTDAKTRLQMRLQGAAFLVLFLAAVGLAAWLSTRYHFTADWTAGSRNTLTESSRALLARLDGPVTVTSWATETDAVRNAARDLIERYRRHKPDMTLAFTNPDTNPTRARELGITVDGELVIEYQGRSERLRDFTEQGLTNALQRVARGGERWIVFTEGHGERDPQGQANHDYGLLGKELGNRGVQLRRASLAAGGAVPDNAAALVVASPQRAFLPGEAKLLREHVERGGNLLWLADPGDEHGLRDLAALLGVSFLKGIVVDATTQVFGIRDPAIALVVEYPDHPLTREMASLTVFPQAQALDFKAPEGWQARPFLRTLDRAWTETGPISGTVRFDADRGERKGPLTLGLALTRPRPGAQEGERAGEQRIAIVGDGDFLANQFLGNGGNLDLGLSLVNWVAHDDTFVAIPARAAVDAKLELPRGLSLVIGLGFLIVLPLGLVAAGVTIWLRRRRR